MAVASAVSQFVALVLERDRLLQEREDAITNELATRKVKERMDEFLAMATHDLRSPVAVAKLAAQDARRRIERQIAAIAGTEAAAALPTATLYTNLNMIEDSMNRLVRLVDRLMDVSRVRAGRLELRREPYDLRHIIHQIVEEQRLLAPERVMRLRLPSHAVIVLVDADRISQVVTNFLTNALRYASAQSLIDITLRIIRGQAHLSVRDRGPGIRPEEQAGIWERFQQAEQGKAKAARSGGLGIGLYISREIIQLHGGQTGMRSVSGKGSIFWFTLPLDQDASDNARPVLGG
jgi:signal transduction histidine kinase